MFLSLRISDGDVSASLEAPEDLGHFSVEFDAKISLARRADLLRELEIGRFLDGGDVAVAVVALRRLSEGRVSAGWSERFDRMIAMLDDHAWLIDGGHSIVGHVEAP